MDQINVETLYCDDIRTEDNGKRLLVGAYSDEILFSKLPVSDYSISAFIIVRGIKDLNLTPELSIKLKLRLNDAILQEYDAKINLDKGYQDYLVRSGVEPSLRGDFTFRGLSFDNYGLLSISLSFNGDENEYTSSPIHVIDIASKNSLQNEKKHTSKEDN